VDRWRVEYLAKEASEAFDLYGIGFIIDQDDKVEEKQS